MINIKDNVKLLIQSVFHGVFLQIFLSFAVSLTTLSDGLYVGWSAAKISELTSENSTSKLTLYQASLLGTLPLYVNPIILPIAIYSTDKIGRKWTILWGATLTLSSWVCFNFAEKIEFIYSGVVLRGFGVFILYTTTEIYIAEIAEAKIRGFLCSSIAILMNFGVLLSYFCVMCSTLENLALVGIAVILLFYVCFFWAPKTPYFLFMKNIPLEARSSLAKLRNTKNIDEELNDIKMTIERNNKEKITIKQFFTDKINRKVSFIVLAIGAIQQFTGIDTILLFLEVIFEASDSTLSSKASSIIFGSVKLLSCAVSLVLLDKVGRRPLLIFSCAVSAISLTILGLYFFMKDVIESNIFDWSWTLLTILIIYIIGYNVGLGTVPFILGSEMYPTKYKAYGVAACQIMYVVMTIIVTNIFALLKDNFGFYLAFWFLAVLTFAGLLFIIYFIVETKGKSFKQILIDIES